MPKLLVLFQSRSPDVVHLAETVAAGARSVRFAEVDLRRFPITDDANDVTIETGARTHRPLEHVDDVGAYDGLILAVGSASDGAGALLRAIAAFGGSLENKVGAALTSATGTDRRTVLWSVLGPMADRGMILLPAPFTEGASDDDATRRLGRRVAEVVGWVTHARSHHQHEHHPHDHQSHHHH
jgi:NAD(P)H dehydrogenase (quinone)